MKTFPRKEILFIILLTLSLLVSVQEAQALTCAWKNPVSGNFSTFSNWSSCYTFAGGPRAPAATDDVVITKSGTYTVTLDTSTSINSLTIGAPSAGNVTLQSPVTGLPRILTVTNSSTVPSGSVTSFKSVDLAGVGTLTNNGVTYLSGTTITQAVNNFGTIQANLGNSYINGALTTNSGSFIIVNATSMTILGIGSSFTNNGTITLTATTTVDQGYLIVASGTGTLTNVGSITVTGTGTLYRYLQAQLDNKGSITASGPLHIDSSTANQSNSGIIDIGASSALTHTTFTNTGFINFAPGTYLTVNSGTFTNAPTGSLRGLATLDVAAATFSNAGKLFPGGNTNIGTFYVTGALPQTATSVTNIELGVGGNDLIAVTGVATVAGTLNVSLLGGLDPPLGTVYPILTYSSKTGSFATTNLPALTGGKGWSIDNGLSATSLKVVSLMVSQTISFGAAPSLIFGGTGSVSATATSNLPVTFTTATPAVCSVSGNTVTALAVGTCIIVADQAGNGSYYPAPQATQNITVAKASQTISFGVAPSLIFGGTGSVSATATSGLPVSFSTATPAVCTVSGSTVTALAVGPCTIAADQIGDSNYSGAAATQSISVTKASQTISFGVAPSLIFGGTGSVSATATSKQPVTFTTATPAVCSISGNTVTALAVGTCTIAADQAGDGSYYAAPQATQNISVAKASQTISFGAAPSLTLGGTGTVSATATSKLPVTFATATPAVCSVSGSTVTALTAGTCTISADQVGNSSYSTAPQATQSIIVGAASQTISFGAAPSLTLGGTGTVSATATSNLPVTFATATPAVCSVSGSTVTALTAGTCTISADQVGNSSYSGAAATQSIIVAKVTPVITWVNPADMLVGTPLSSVQLNATATVPGSFVYTPASGTVLGLGAGQSLSVLFTPNDPANYITPAAKTVLINVVNTVTWQQTNGPYSGDISSLAIDPATPQTLYAGTNGSGVFKSVNGGTSWSPVNSGLTTYGVSCLAIPPFTPQALYVGTTGGVFKSLDGGSSWSVANGGLTSTTSVSSIAVDPTNAQTLYAGAQGGVFKSIDGGSSWNSLNNGLITAPFVTSVAVDPATPQTLYTGTNNGGVFKSTDGGTTWTAINNGLTGIFVESLAIDPITPQTLYAGTANGGIFKSVNSGTVWSPVNNGLPTPNRSVNSLVIDRIAPQTLYAGTDAGVFKSIDGGANWNAFNSGLTMTSVLSLAFDTGSPQTLYAGTSNSGVFKSTATASSLPANQVATGADGKTTTPLTVTTADGAIVTLGTGTLLTDASGNPISGTLTVTASVMSTIAALPSGLATSKTTGGASLAALGNSIDITISAGAAMVKKINPPMIVTLAIPASFAVPGTIVPYYSYNGTTWTPEGTATVKADGTVDILVGHLSVWAVAIFSDGILIPTQGKLAPALTDALKSLSFAMKVETPTAAELLHGDVAPLVNGVSQPDGEINLGDTIVTLRRVVGL
jgi:photosystem II stability/assembly factor-like uncharacterized protein